MPNHVRNIITVDADAETRLKIRAALVSRYDGASEEAGDSGKEYFDFNKLIPMPEYIFRGNLGQEEREKYGANNWYDWSCENWGTKWNAYDCYISEDGSVYEFNTAWDIPKPIYLELGAKFPEADFHIEYAEEQIGYYCGIYDISGDNIEFTDMSEGAVENKEAVEYWCKIWDCDPDELGLVFNEETGQYEYHDEDEEDEGE